jgi:EAL domain-containing protein (putative c-di-GMP-specific phosphodiesterase class I)
MNDGVRDWIGGNCTVSLMLLAVGALYKRGWVEWMTTQTYQAASGAGARNMVELLKQMQFFSDNLRNDLAGEASGRMSVIDRWVLTSTLAWLDKHQDQLRSTRFVCMNLSGASLNDEKFLADVYELLEKNRHLVGQICLEITESVALHDIDNTRRFVNKVRRIGARVALDDFGAGYTSFSYLKEFTADLLKIDGSFIVNMNKHPANIAIVEAIVNLAKNLGMKVIAEWAEDNATVQTLTDIGVDYVQGFIVSRSQHPDKLLLAQSSASFIKDEELAHMMSLVGKTDVAVAQVDLFVDATANRLH